jgi:hypothetical protein
MPYLRPFLEAFPSGMLQPDEIRRRGLTYVDISQGFTMENVNGAGSKTYTLRDLDTSGTNRTIRGFPSSAAKETDTSTSRGRPSTNISATRKDFGFLSTSRAALDDDKMAITVRQSVDITGQEIEAAGRDVSRYP